MGEASVEGRDVPSEPRRHLSETAIWESKVHVFAPPSASGQTDPWVVKGTPPEPVLYNVARRLSATLKRRK